MRYTVTSHPDMEDKLALIWLQAPDKNAVARASDEIDRLLKHTSLDVGEPDGTNRAITIDPLKAIYTVSPNDRLVQILDYIYTG